MHNLLKHIEKEVQRLKTETANNTTMYDLVLVFDRSEEQMRRLKGYETFIQALEELGGQRTEENIQEACRRSHFHRDSVYFGESETEEFPMRLRCTRSQITRMAHKH